jgi:hypothetical protein
MKDEKTIICEVKRNISKTVSKIEESLPELENNDCNRECIEKG